MRDQDGSLLLQQPQGLSRRAAVSGSLLAAGGLLGASTFGQGANGREAPVDAAHIVMRYSFALRGQGAIESAWESAARLGPTFDGCPGIVFKLCLIDAFAPSLGSVTLWATPRHARTYLGSAEFESQMRAFGRPDLHLELPISATQPPADLREVTLVDGGASGPGINWLDAADGSRSSLLYGSGHGRKLDVAYVARGDAA